VRLTVRCAYCMDLVVLSHLDPTVFGKGCYLFNCELRFFCKQTIVSRNKPTTNAMSSVMWFCE